MAEKSFVWAGITLGDADQAPYDADEWTDIWNALFIRDKTDQGYIDGYLNELAVTNPAGSTIRVATGGALVDGTFYETDAVVDNTISTPSVSTRIDRYVLRKSWAAQTVRVAVVAGVEGAGAPTLTQTDGVTWEIPLAQVTITTGAAITVLDERVICRSPLAFEAEGAWQEISNAQGDGISSSIDFSGIPTTYRHLVMVINGRSTDAALREIVEMIFNNDSGANYDFQSLVGNGASAIGAGTTGATAFDIGEIVAGTGVANRAGQIVLWITNYKGTALDKQFTSDFNAIPIATTSTFHVGKYGGTWDNVSAIDQITLTLANGGFWGTDSDIVLYGVK